MGGDPAAPITPRQIGIPLFISRKKIVCPLRRANGSCAAGPPTAALQCFCKIVQPDGMVRYRRARARARQPGCILQVTMCMEPSSHGGCDPSHELNGPMGRRWPTRRNPGTTDQQARMKIATRVGFANVLTTGTKSTNTNARRFLWAAVPKGTSSKLKPYLEDLPHPLRHVG